MKVTIVNTIAFRTGTQRTKKTEIKQNDKLKIIIKSQLGNKIESSKYRNKTEERNPENYTH
jgi:ribosomal protein L23